MREEYKHEIGFNFDWIIKVHKKYVKNCKMDCTYGLKFINNTIFLSELKFFVAFYAIKPFDFFYSLEFWFENCYSCKL